MGASRLEFPACGQRDGVPPRRNGGGPRHGSWRLRRAGYAEAPGVPMAKPCRGRRLQPAGPHVPVVTTRGWRKEPSDGRPAFISRHIMLNWLARKALHFGTSFEIRGTLLPEYRRLRGRDPTVPPGLRRQIWVRTPSSETSCSCAATRGIASMAGPSRRPHRPFRTATSSASSQP